MGDLSDERLAVFAEMGHADSDNTRMAREIQRRRAQDAGDRCARTLADAFAPACGRSGRLAAEACADWADVVAYHDAVAAERKAERPGLREALDHVGEMIGQCSETAILDAVMWSLRDYRANYGSIDAALEAEA